MYCLETCILRDINAVPTVNSKNGRICELLVLYPTQQSIKDYLPKKYHQSSAKFYEVFLSFAVLQFEKVTIEIDLISDQKAINIYPLSQWKRFQLYKSGQDQKNFPLCAHWLTSSDCYSNECRESFFHKNKSNRKKENQHCYYFSLAEKTQKNRKMEKSLIVFHSSVFCRSLLSLRQKESLRSFCTQNNKKGIFTFVYRNNY